MNDLQKYILLLNISAAKIAKATRLGYHSVQKNIRGVRNNSDVRDAIADYLGLSRHQIWGKNSSFFLHRLIEKEIDRKTESERKRLRKRYLCRE